LAGLRHGCRQHTHRQPAAGVAELGAEGSLAVFEGGLARIEEHLELVVLGQVVPLADLVQVCEYTQRPVSARALGGGRGRGGGHTEHHLVAGLVHELAACERHEATVLDLHCVLVLLRPHLASLCRFFTEPGRQHALAQQLFPLV
jgi:hypothetical protein